MSDSNQDGPITAVVREALRSPPIPLAAIARQTGIAPQSLYRFARSEPGSGSLSVTTLDKLADVLGLRLVVRGSYAAARAEQLDVDRQAVINAAAEQAAKLAAAQLEDRLRHLEQLVLEGEKAKPKP